MSSSRRFDQAARAAAFLMLAAASTGLAGCAERQAHLGQDFGSALRQELVAQVADPDAHYSGKPAPGSDGARVAGAQARYGAGKVTEPTAPRSSTVGASAAAPAAH